MEDAKYVSIYTGQQVDNTIGLFNGKGLGDVTGFVKRKADGTFEAGTPGEGSVTSIGLQNSTDGGLNISGSPVTSSGTISIGHTNVLSAAETTAKLFPIKYDKNGHITGVGTEVTSLPASDVYSWAKAVNKPTYTYSEVGAASSDHVHGNITNGGDIIADAPTVVNGDRIIINDDSESKITNGPAFDGSTTTQALTKAGTWGTFLTEHQSLDGYVPTSRTVNNKALTSDISITASDVGLGDVGNFKAVSTVASQGLTDTEKSNARSNIGAGTSSLTIGTTDSTAAAGNHIHGNITNDGDITAAAPTIVSGDQLIINDDSEGKITNGPSFDGSTTTKALTPKGTWENFLQTHQSLDGYVPTSRKINNKALTNDIVLTINDIGATVLVVEQSNVSSLPVTISDSKITADHIVVNYILSNPSAQTGDWTVTTSDGSLQVSGNISGTTNIKLLLALS